MHHKNKTDKALARELIRIRIAQSLGGKKSQSMFTPAQRSERARHAATHGKRKPNTQGDS